MPDSRWRMNGTCHIEMVMNVDSFGAAFNDLLAVLVCF